MAERIKAATPGAASGKRRKDVFDLSVRREGGEEGAGGGGAESGEEGSGRWAPFITACQFAKSRLIGRLRARSFGVNVSDS